jgi:hypothetical protein
VVAKSKDEDLRRLYVASLNFMYTSAILYGHHLYNIKLNNKEAEDNDPPLAQILPPEAVAVLNGDPITAAVIAEDEATPGERNSEQAGKTEERADVDMEAGAGEHSPEIRSTERLLSFVSVLEKAVVILRKHLKTIQGPHSWAQLVNALKTLGAMDNREDDDCEGMCPRVYILREEFFGYPAGTRLVCVNVLMFHMDLVRVGGRLRILNVYITGD